MSRFRWPYRHQNCGLPEETGLPVAKSPVYITDVIAFPSASGYSCGVERTRALLAILLLFLGLLSGCNKGANSSVIDFAVGEKAPNPPITYSVIETTWKTQLGEGFNTRRPQNRFLMVRLSATNGGGSEVGLPLFSLTDVNGTEYREIDNGEGVDHWFGLLRNIGPAQTMQGSLVFDVPLASYRIRLPNGGDTGEEKWVTINLPLHLDVDQSVQGPTVGGGLK